MRTKGGHGIIPLLIIEPSGLYDYRCLECGRWAYFTPDRLWRHYRHIWRGRTYR